MSVINFNPSDGESKGGSKRLKYLFGIGLLAGALVLGNTFASNISLNSSGNVEFGQGVAQTVTCGGTDVSITITPESTFTNEESGGRFRFSGFKVTDIPTECNGIDFTFKFFGETGGALDPIQYDWVANEYPQDFNKTDVNVHFLGEETTGGGSNNLWTDNDFGFPASKDYADVNDRPDAEDSRTNSSFEVTFWYDANSGRGISTDELKKITVETSKIIYRVGGTGPGGGIIFLTPELSGTPYYYEVSPINLDGSYSLCADNQSRAISDSIGFGFQNSATLFADDLCNDLGNAAYGIHNFSYGGKSDWYLPSRYEMVAVRTNVLNELNNVSAFYLTSSQMSANSVWIISMFNTNPNQCGHEQWSCTNYKAGSNDVRPIRRWSY